MLHLMFQPPKIVCFAILKLLLLTELKLHPCYVVTRMQKAVQTLIGALSGSLLKGAMLSRASIDGDAGGRRVQAVSCHLSNLVARFQRVSVRFSATPLRSPFTLTSVLPSWARLLRQLSSANI